MIAPGKANKPLASRLGLELKTDWYNTRVEFAIVGILPTGERIRPPRETPIPHAPEPLPALPFRLDLTI
jgi:hypothetical protein